MNERVNKSLRQRREKHRIVESSLNDHIIGKTKHSKCGFDDKNVIILRLMNNSLYF